MSLREFLEKHENDEGEVGNFIRSSQLVMSLMEVDSDPEYVRKATQTGYLLDCFSEALEAEGE